MDRHISFKRQRVPMVDGETLDHRTRPDAEASVPVEQRMRYLGLAASTGGLLAFSEKKSGRPPFEPSGSR